MVEGWLLKRTGGKGDGSRLASFGSLRQKWELRFVVILRGKLQYFKSAAEYHHGKAKPTGTLDLRNATVIDNGDEAEPDQDRVHKFILVGPERELHLCAETEDIKNEWITGVGAVVGLQMRSWRVEDVLEWLGINRLDSLLEVFDGNNVSGQQLHAMDNDDAVPQPILLSASDAGSVLRADLDTLIQRVALLNGAHPRPLSPRGEHAGELSPKAEAGELPDTSGFDCFLIYHPEQEELASQFVESLPPAPDGEPWEVFRGNGLQAPEQAEREAEARMVAALDTDGGGIITLDELRQAAAAQATDTAATRKKARGALLVRK